MSTVEVFLVAMLMIFGLPYLVWRLCRTDHYMPLVVMQVIMGVALGPGIAGAAYPDYYAFVFTEPVQQALNGIAWWAVMLLVWIAGIELDLDEAWRHRRESSIAALLAFSAPFLLGCGAALAMLRIEGLIGHAARPWQFTLGIGMTCAVTSLPVLILLMERLEIMRQDLGQRILRYASLDDIAIWSALALILMDFERVGRQVAFLAAFPLAVYGIRKLMPRLREADRLYVGLIWLAASGFAADWAGLHFLVGAFLSGAALDRQWFSRRLDHLRDDVLLLVMPVFFLSAGLRTQWTLGSGTVIVAAGLLLAVSIAGKLLGVHIAGRILGWKSRESWIIGWMLQTKALVLIMFASVLLDKQLITNDMFTALLLMALVSTVLTVPIVAPMLGRAQNAKSEEGVSPARELCDGPAGPGVNARNPGA